MNAGPWACVVGEPVIVPVSVHYDGTCQSRSLICYVVPHVISLLRRRLIHVYIYLAQVPPHRFSDSSLDHTCELVLFRKLSTPAVLLIDFSTCRGIVFAVCAFLVDEEGLACGFRGSYLRSGWSVRVLIEFFFFLLCPLLLNLTFLFLRFRHSRTSDVFG